jgi:hypothetical protein
MKYTIEMGSGPMMYIPSFMKIGSAIQKMIERDAQTAWSAHKPTFIFQNKERMTPTKIRLVFLSKRTEIIKHAKSQRDV